MQCSLRGKEGYGSTTSSTQVNTHGYKRAQDELMLVGMPCGVLRVQVNTSAFKCEPPLEPGGLACSRP